MKGLLNEDALAGASQTAPSTIAQVVPGDFSSLAFTPALSLPMTIGKVAQVVPAVRAPSTATAAAASASSSSWSSSAPNGRLAAATRAAVQEAALEQSRRRLRQVGVQEAGIQQDTEQSASSLAKVDAEVLRVDRPYPRGAFGEHPFHAEEHTVAFTFPFSLVFTALSSILSSSSAQLSSPPPQPSSSSPPSLPPSPLLSSSAAAEDESIDPLSTPSALAAAAEAADKEGVRIPRCRVVAFANAGKAGSTSLAMLLKHEPPEFGK